MFGSMVPSGSAQDRPCIGHFGARPVRGNSFSYASSHWLGDLCLSVLAIRSSERNVITSESNDAMIRVVRVPSGESAIEKRNA